MNWEKVWSVVAISALIFAIAISGLMLYNTYFKPHSSVKVLIVKRNETNFTVEVSGTWLRSVTLMNLNDGVNTTLILKPSVSLSKTIVFPLKRGKLYMLEVNLSKELDRNCPSIDFDVSDNIYKEVILFGTGVKGDFKGALYIFEVCKANESAYDCALRTYEEFKWLGQFPVYHVY